MKQANEEISKIPKDINEKESELEDDYVVFEKSTKKSAFLKNLAKIGKLLNEYINQLWAAKINQIQTCTFDMFKKLLSKGDMVQNLSINPQTYLITIKNNSGLTIRKEELSPGEKEIFAISLLWGLAQTSQY